MTDLAPFPPWVWIPERFNMAVACTGAHLGTWVAERPAVVIDDDRSGVRPLTFARTVERTPQGVRP